MEPERNSENWSQPSENWSQSSEPSENQTQPSTCQQPPEEESFFQKEQLQQTWLNVKLATWLKCLIIIAALLVTAALVVPKFTSAKSQQQDTSDYYSEFEDDYYDDYYDYED